MEFWTLQLLNFKDVLQPMIDRYEREHPGIRIHWVDLPFSEGEKRVLTAILSPNVPDVVNLNPDFSALLANRKAVLDMNQALPQATRAQYLPVAWQACSLGRFAFGIPWYLTSKVTLYNQDLLRQAGWTQPPESFHALADFSRALRLHSKQSAYSMMPSLSENGAFLKELQQIGMPLFDPRSGKAVFAVPAAVRHLQFWVDMYRSGDIPAESLTEGHQAAVDRYQSGSLALLLSGPNFLNIVQENAPDVFQKTGVAPQFPMNSPMIEFASMLLAVPVKSSHPREALSFALYITNAANQLAFSHRAPVLPSVLPALRNAYFQDIHSTVLIDRARSISAMQLLQAKSAYTIQPNQKEINEIMDYYVQMALLGKMGAKTALEKAQREINAQDHVGS